MDLNTRLLAFLEHEMQQIVDDRDRDSEDRHNASTILGRIEGEMEWEQEQIKNGDVDAEKLLS